MQLPGLESDEDDDEGEADSQETEAKEPTGSKPQSDPTAPPSRGRLKRLRDSGGSPGGDAPDVRTMFGDDSDEDGAANGTEGAKEGPPTKRRNVDLFGDSDEDE